MFYTQLVWIPWFLGNVELEDDDWVSSCWNISRYLLLQSTGLGLEELARNSVHTVVLCLNLLLSWSSLLVVGMSSCNSTKTWTKENKKEQLPLNCFKVFGKRTSELSEDLWIFVLSFSTFCYKILKWACNEAEGIVIGCLPISDIWQLPVYSS